MENRNEKFYKNPKIILLSKEDIEKRNEQNKKTLTEIFNEILEVCKQINATTCRNSRAILENRFRYLKNKYSFSNGLDELITFK